MINKYAGAQIASLAKPAVDAGRKVVGDLLSKMKKDPEIYDPLDPTYLVNHDSGLSSKTKEALIKERDQEAMNGLVRAVSGNKTLTDRVRSLSEKYNEDSTFSKDHASFEDYLRSDTELGVLYQQSLNDANSKMLKKSNGLSIQRSPIDADYVEIPSEGKRWSNGKVSAWDANTTRDPKAAQADYIRITDRKNRNR